MFVIYWLVLVGFIVVGFDCCFMLVFYVGLLFVYLDLWFIYTSLWLFACAYVFLLVYVLFCTFSRRLIAWFVFVCWVGIFLFIWNIWFFWVCWYWLWVFCCFAIMDGLLTGVYVEMGVYCSVCFYCFLVYLFWSLRFLWVFDCVLGLTCCYWMVGNMLVTWFYTLIVLIAFALNRYTFDVCYCGLLVVLNLGVCYCFRFYYFEHFFL